MGLASGSVPLNLSNSNGTLSRYHYGVELQYEELAIPHGQRKPNFNLQAVAIRLFLPNVCLC